MFGISWTEFLVIILVAIVIVPVRMWPDVARFLARAVSFVRKIIWKITDASEQIKQQIDLEQPIDDLIQSAKKDILSDFSQVVPAKKIAGKLPAKKAQIPSVKKPKSKAEK